jgi:hypothetical protein
MSVTWGPPCGSRGIDALEAVFAEVLRRFDTSREFAAAGAVSSVAWLGWRCHLSPGTASQRLSMAQHLGDLPRTRAALFGGEIGCQQAAQIARTAGQIGVEPVREAEPVLVEAARKVAPKRFGQVTAHLRHCVDQDACLADANAAFERRRLSLSQTLDGVYYLEGRLDPEAGAALQEALGALGKPLPGDERSAPQRRADALGELARRQLEGGGLPEVGGQKPHLTVTASLETLAGMSGQPGGELEWGAVLPGETMRRLACDAAATLVVLDGEGSPLSLGRTVRTIPPWLRRALVARDGGCRWPGCDRPPEWTDGHHMISWEEGGPTDLTNCCLVCRRHHRMVHDAGWRLVWGENGSVVAIPPPRFRLRPSSPPQLAAYPDG